MQLQVAGTTGTGGTGERGTHALRLRWVERDDRKTCQAMLISVATKEQRHFADLESLVAFLQGQAPGESVANPVAQGKEDETM